MNEVLKNGPSMISDSHEVAIFQGFGGLKWSPFYRLRFIFYSFTKVIVETALFHHCWYQGINI